MIYIFHLYKYVVSNKHIKPKYIKILLPPTVYEGHEDLTLTPSVEARKKEEKTGDEDEDADDGADDG